MKVITLVCLFFVLTHCTSSNDQSMVEKKPTDKFSDSTELPLNKIYSQNEGRDELATLSLRHDHVFEFEDMRDESCWVWSTTFGKWHLEDDTLILSPNKEANSLIKLQNREFFMRNDSLIFIKSREKNPYINWGGFKLKME